MADLEFVCNSDEGCFNHEIMNDGHDIMSRQTLIIITHKFYHLLSNCIICE